LAAAAQKLGVELVPVEVDNADQVAQALVKLRSDRADALFIRDVGMFFRPDIRRQIAEFALQQQLPVIGPDAVFAESGGLMSYGPSTVDLWRRSAWYIDRIFKGAKPGDLPIQLPTRFELVINQKTAKVLGITFPPVIMIQATRVIE
jgi:putative ABC transport system substrate-binding protein